MSGDGAALAEAARRYLGTPFHLHGRSREEGLDCVGLLACTLADIGCRAVLPLGYGLRNRQPEAHLACLARSGFERQPDSAEVQTGDVIVVLPGPAQQHLLIAAAPDSFIHAHAGLRRVVLTGPPFPWRVAQHWRLSGSLPKD